MELKIEYLPIDELRPYLKNARKHGEEDVHKIAQSIERYGFNDPIGIWKDNVIVEGHGRLMAAEELNLDVVPVIRLDHLTDEQRREYAIAHNRTAEFSEWDFNVLKKELAELDFGDFDLEFDENTDEEEKEKEPDGKYADGVKGSLSQRYIVPPFSVMDAMSGAWQSRKKEWLKIIHSGDGRKGDLLGDGLNTLISNWNKNSTLTGTSIFDPVLCETLVAWFCPKDGKVIDPFAGGSVRGLIASFTGHDYVGMDLRQEQIDANNEAYSEVETMLDFYGQPLRSPTWICADSLTIDEKVDGKYDFAITCPPYADLEKYSDDPADLSNMEYPEFVDAYSKIIQKTVGLLADNAYFAIVVGEVRSADGSYYNFVGDTIKACINAGLRYYNEIILKTPCGTAALRSENTFGKYRKVVKVHQNVLVFVKGDEKKIKVEPYDYEFPSDEE